MDKSNVRSNKKFQSLLRKAINKEGTTVNFAEKLGVTPTAVSYWEKGTRLPDVKLVLKLEKIYGIPPKVARPDIF